MKKVKSDYASCLHDCKRLRELLNDDHSAVSNYLGLVLAKPTADLAPGEKEQVRTLLKDTDDA